jgi:hypothetical protein
MTEGALLLQSYLTNAGFTPLASEWWRFNDLNGARIANEAGINGEFFTESIYSSTPNLQERSVKCRGDYRNRDMERCP